MIPVFRLAGNYLLWILHFIWRKEIWAVNKGENENTGGAQWKTVLLQQLIFLL